MKLPERSERGQPGTRARAITNSGQLQNNCSLFVWQNQDNFMQSVISIVMTKLIHKPLLFNWNSKNKELLF